jgi:hypothetical protein
MRYDVMIWVYDWVAKHCLSSGMSAEGVCRFLVFSLRRYVVIPIHILLSGTRMCTI